MLGLRDARYKTIFFLWCHPKPSFQSFLSLVPALIMRQIQASQQTESSITGVRRDQEVIFHLLLWFLFWHFQKHMAPCSANALQGCAVPPSCFPERAVPPHMLTSACDGAWHCASACQQQEGRICAAHPPQGPLHFSPFCFRSSLGLLEVMSCLFCGC